MAADVRSGDLIVAEISKNWIDSTEVVPTPPLCQLFEQVIARNRSRGYHLHSFQLHRLMVSLNQMNETIIAVFEWDGR